MDPLDQLRSKLLELTEKSAFDGRPFVLTQELAHWFQAPADDKPEESNWKHLTSAISTRRGISRLALHHLKLDSYMKIICTLIQIGCTSAVKVFVRNNITDSTLPLQLERLENLASTFTSNLFPKEVTLEFYRVQWRYFPAQFNLGRSYTLDRDTVVPICSSELVGVGNTAQVYQIAVPEEFVGKELSATLSWAKFKDERHQGVSVSPVFLTSCQILHET